MPGIANRHFTKVPNGNRTAPIRFFCQMDWIAARGSAMTFAASLTTGFAANTRAKVYTHR